MISWIVTIFHDCHFKCVPIIHRCINALAVPPQVNVYAATSQDRTSATVVDSHLRAKNTYRGSTLHKNCICCQQRMIFLNNWFELIEKSFTSLKPTWWQVCRHTTNSYIAVCQPRAAHLLVRAAGGGSGRRRIMSASITTRYSNAPNSTADRLAPCESARKRSTDVGLLYDG